MTKSISALNEEDVDTSNNKHLYRNISLQLSIDRDCCAHQQWWVIQEVCDDRFYLELLQNIPLNDCKEVTMFLFNDKVFPEGLSFISGFG